MLTELRSIMMTQNFHPWSLYQFATLLWQNIRISRSPTDYFKHDLISDHKYKDLTLAESSCNSISTA